MDIFDVDTFYERGHNNNEFDGRRVSRTLTSMKKLVGVIVVGSQEERILWLYPTPKNKASTP